MYSQLETINYAPLVFFLCPYSSIHIVTNASWNWCRKISRKCPFFIVTITALNIVLGSATGWMSVSPYFFQIHMLKLTFHVIVSGGEVFGRWLGPEGGTFLYGISALIQRPQRAPSPFHPEDTVRRHQETGPHQTPNLPALSLPQDFPNSRTEIDFCCF